MPEPAHTHAPVALITGAGTGIGREIAVQLSILGYRLALVGRRKEALEATAALCPASGLILPCDLEADGEAERMIDTAVAHMGRLDALINNAGWSPAATIPQTDAATIRRVFALNAEAPAIAISRAWPIFERQWRADQSRAVIVNVSSVATLDPYPTLYAYAAAKASVNLLAKSAANLGKDIGVRAFAVAPGAVETDLLRTIVSKEMLPESLTLTPEAVARVIVECVQGLHDARSGETIFLHSPSAA